MPLLVSVIEELTSQLRPSAHVRCVLAAVSLIALAAQGLAQTVAPAPAFDAERLSALPRDVAAYLLEDLLRD
jgi:hypothetical protein